MFSKKKNNNSQSEKNSVSNDPFNPKYLAAEDLSTDRTFELPSDMPGTAEASKLRTLSPELIQRMIESMSYAEAHSMLQRCVPAIREVLLSKLPEESVLKSAGY